MADIFLSYKSEDRPRAEIIAKALENQGFTIWWDPVIPPGRDFDEVIVEELEAAHCIIVLWSKESIRSKWIKTEASEGDRRGILIPVMIDDVQPPLQFRMVEAAKLIDWDGTLPHPEFTLLLESVKRICGPKQKPVDVVINSEIIEKNNGDRGLNEVIVNFIKFIKEKKVHKAIVFVIFAAFILFFLPDIINIINGLIAPELFVPEEPFLGVSNIYLEEKKSDFDPFQFYIENEGRGTLKWNISADKPWIGIIPTHGTDYSEVSVIIDTSNLTRGEESGIIKITSNGGNETRSINLTILPINNPTGWPRQFLDEGDYWEIKYDDRGFNKGYMLAVNAIDPNTKTVVFVLYRNGIQLEPPKILTEGQIYNCRNNTFTAYVNKIKSPSADKPYSSVELTNISIS